jgi:hypothetical protein
VPSFLIKVTWGKWQTDEPWLPPGELPANALFDLRFPNNKLSAWRIEDGNTNLDRVITALAVNKGKTSIDNVDYILLEQKTIEELGVKMEKSRGTTPDVSANDEWHFDLIELTVSKIVSLAKCIKELEIFRKREPQVKDLIRIGLKENHFDLNLVDDKLRARIQGLQ